MFSLKDGELAVSIARRTLESHLSGKDIPRFKFPPHFEKKSGVFVTLNTYPRKELRGCIGFPEPTFPLIDAIQDAARSASTRDPRFPPMRKVELSHVTVEVSMLTPPKHLKVKKPTELLELIEVGRDGLIMEKGPFRGLLLPQVPVEQGWDIDTFLSHTCMKAGMKPDCWIDRSIKVYSFSASVYMEKTPNGEVVAKPLK